MEVPQRLEENLRQLSQTLDSTIVAVKKNGPRGELSVEEKRRLERRDPVLDRKIWDTKCTIKKMQSELDEEKRINKSLKEADETQEKIECKYQTDLNQLKIEEAKIQDNFLAMMGYNVKPRISIVPVKQETPSDMVPKQPHFKKRKRVVEVNLDDEDDDQHHQQEVHNHPTEIKLEPDAWPEELPEYPQHEPKLELLTDQSNNNNNNNMKPIIIDENVTPDNQVRDTSEQLMNSSNIKQEEEDIKPDIKPDINESSAKHPDKKWRTSTSNIMFECQMCHRRYGYVQNFLRHNNSAHNAQAKYVKVESDGCSALGSLDNNTTTGTKPKARRYFRTSESKVRRIKTEESDDDEGNVTSDGNGDYHPDSTVKIKKEICRKTIKRRSAFVKKGEKIMNGLTTTKKDLMSIENGSLTEGTPEVSVVPIVVPPSIDVYNYIKSFGPLRVSGLALVLRKPEPKKFRTVGALGMVPSEMRMEIETNIRKDDLIKRLDILKECRNIRTLVIHGLAEFHEGFALEYLLSLGIHKYCPFIQTFIVGENEAPVFTHYVQSLGPVNCISSLEIKVSYHHEMEIADAISKCPQLNSVFFENTTCPVVEASVNLVQVFSATWTSMKEFDTFTRLAKDLSRITALQLSIVHLPLDRLRFKSLAAAVPKLEYISLTGDLQFIHYLKYFENLVDVKWETVPFNINEGYKDKYVKSHWNRKSKREIKRKQQIFSEMLMATASDNKTDDHESKETDVDSDATDIESDVSLSDATETEDDSSGTDVSENDADNNFDLNYLQAKRNKSDHQMSCFLESMGSRLKQLCLTLDNKYNYSLLQNLSSKCSVLTHLTIMSGQADQEFKASSFFIPSLIVIKMTGVIFRDIDFLDILDHNPKMTSITFESSKRLTAHVIPILITYAEENIKNRGNMIQLTAAISTQGFEDYKYQLLNPLISLSYIQEKTPPIARKTRPTCSR